MAVSNNPNHMFAAPIPGQGLTQAPKSAPWQQPPQFVHEQDALNYFWEHILQDPETVTRLMVLLKGGVAVTEIVNTLLFTGIAGGKWTPDLAMLMYQEVAWMIEALAKIRKIKYTFKRINPDFQKFLLQYKDYIQEPEATPTDKVAKSVFFGNTKVQ